MATDGPLPIGSLPSQTSLVYRLSSLVYRVIFATNPDSDPAMHTLPEFSYIVLLLGFFVAVFVVSNVVARAAGYRE